MAGWRYRERVPVLTQRLWLCMGAEARRESPPPPAPRPATFAVPTDDPDILADYATPPIGRLLRSVAAQTVAVRADDVAARVLQRASEWSDRIRVMLAGWDPDERIFPLRG